MSHGFTGLRPEDVNLLMDRFGAEGVPLTVEQAAHKYRKRREEVRVIETRAYAQLLAVRALLACLGLVKLPVEAPDEDLADDYPHLYARG